MDQDNIENPTSDTPTVADRLARATLALADTLSNLHGQFASIHAKIDRIIAAVDDGELQVAAQAGTALHHKVAELEKANHDLKAQTAVARRKTLSPMVTALLAKEGVEGDAVVETPIIEKALAGLSIEQRIAVKAELARAGILV
ncbi:MAG TPA: hypothetical protein VLV47_00370 [Candidatus Bathyarchaeia archaeon]|nr:hypothetical protein [Candidatus Bathyarchaeia archaeon]